MQSDKAGTAGIGCWGTSDDRNSTAERLVKVNFDLSNDGGPVATESLWAEPLGDGRCRLRNVPFFTYSFSEQDVVSEAKGGATFFRQPNGKLSCLEPGRRGS